MNRLLPFILFCLPFFGFSQKDTIAHLYTFGSVANDVGEDISATSDGGLVVVGSTASSGDGNTDVYLLKIDSACNREWSWALGGSNNDWGYSVKETYDKGFIIAVSSNSYGNGGYDAMLMKRDSLGNFQWQKTYGGDDWDFAYDVIQTYDSGYVFCGETYTNSAGFSDVYVVKTDVFGDTLWTRTVGGSLVDKGNALIETSDSTIVVAGIKNTLTDSSQAYVLKFDKNGVLLWDNLFGYGRQESAHGLTTTQDGGVVFTGKSTSFGPGDLDYYVVKVDAYGNTVWEQPFISPQNEEGFDIFELANGNFMNVGYTDSYGGGKKDAHIFMITSGGNWGGQGSTFGALYDEISKGFAMGLNGAMYLAGTTDGYGMGLNDLMVIRIDTIVKHQQFTVVINNDIAVIGMKELFNNTALRIFPNPTNSSIIVHSINYPIQLQMVDNSGKIILMKNLNELDNYLDLSSISSGFYSLRFSNSSGFNRMEKLIITN